MTTTAPTPIRRSVRLATMSRWRAALSRAFQKGIGLRYEASTGMAVVTSSSDDALCYVTDGRICTCQAGENGDPVCQHRALYWFRRGLLNPDPPLPPTGIRSFSDLDIELHNAGAIAFLEDSMPYAA
jgi:hypothetical protein